VNATRSALWGDTSECPQRFMWVHAAGVPQTVLSALSRSLAAETLSPPASRVRGPVSIHPLCGTLSHHDNR
jgi:hypothetical protein